MLNLCKKHLLLIIVFPWILLSPILMVREFKSFHLVNTIKMSEKDRHIYFFKKGIGFEDDYFQLLDKAVPYLQDERKYIKFNLGENLPPMESQLWLNNFAFFYFGPNRVRQRDQRKSLKLFYRKTPLPEDGRILETISAKYPSYVVEPPE